MNPTPATPQEIAFHNSHTAITWARVSPDVDQRLTETAGQPVRLRPDEWTSGEQALLLDVVGEPQALMGALVAVAEGPLKGSDVRVMMRLPDGTGGLQKLHDLVARVATGEPQA